MSEGTRNLTTYTPVYDKKTYSYHFYETDDWIVLGFDVIEDYAFSVVQENFDSRIGMVCHSLRKKNWQWLDLNVREFSCLTVGRVNQLPAAEAVVDGKTQTYNIMPGHKKLNLPYTVASKSKFVPQKKLPITLCKTATTFTSKGETLFTQHTTQFNSKNYLVQLWKVNSGGYKIRRPVLELSPKG